jgi:hypothetical protein
MHALKRTIPIELNELTILHGITSVRVGHPIMYCDLKRLIYLRCADYPVLLQRTSSFTKTSYIGENDKDCSSLAFLS